MKKEYIIPEFELLDLDVNTILAGSDPIEEGKKDSEGDDERSKFGFGFDFED